MKRTTLAVAAVALALAACKTTPQDYILFHAGRDPETSAKHIVERVRACWFEGGRKAFAGLSYAPEVGASSTRILIVPKDEPHGLPQLIIDVRGAKRGTDVRLFGPLMQTDRASSIQADIRRWTGGARDC